MTSLPPAMYGVPKRGIMTVLGVTQIMAWDRPTTCQRSSRRVCQLTRARCCVGWSAAFHQGCWSLA